MSYTLEKKYLAKVDPSLLSLIKRTDFSEFTTRSSEVYEAMVRAIAHQMVHGNAAKACLKRLVERCGVPVRRGHLVPPAQAVRRISLEDLRACGFSQNKARAIFELTEKECRGEIPSTKKLKKMEDAEIIKMLVPLRGIGRWTVEMYLIFSLGRPDVFPVDDFGVREGYRIWKMEKKQRKTAYLRKKALKWSPYGSLVARMLWQEADRHKKIGA